MRSLLNRVLMGWMALGVTAGVLAAGPADGKAPVNGAEVPLIPRRVLFDNPDKAAPRISPDGARLSWLAPVDGVMNVWVAPAGDLASAKPVTRDTNRGIRSYFWAYDNTHIVYVQDKGGDENWRVYSANVVSGDVRDLTPFDGVAAQIEGVSQRIPGEILVGLNNRNPQFHDIHRVNLATGEMTLVQENPGTLGRGLVNGFMTDADYKVRFAATLNTDDGSLSLLQPTDSGEWTEFTNIPMEDQMSSAPLGFDKTGKVLYLTDSRSRDTGAVFTWDLTTNERKLVAEDPLADAGGFMIHPTTYEIQAVSFEYDRERWKIVDKSIQADFDALRKVREGDFDVVSRTLDDKQWIVAFVTDSGPVAYYRWDRPTQKAHFLFNNRTALEKYVLAPMRPVVIKSRDNLNLVSYLTLPVTSTSPGAERPNNPLPTVLLVHGGPWARDSWGYNGLHQMLANRGYAVLSVNFRGSTGFGKSFVNAGNMEWAGKMHNDLIDAVDWAVAEGIADPQRVAIMGGSYGGYATLVGLTYTPDKFACGVDIVGPSNIVTLLNTIPPYWAPAIKMFKDRVGDHTTPEGQAFLHERSPLTHVEKIQRPLLIGQGANDPRVKQSESDQIVAAMQKKNIPVSYVLFPDEGHGFARPENNLAFFAVTDAFLSEHLGGRAEPISTNDFTGSTIQVPTGVEGVPGLSDALPR